MYPVYDLQVTDSCTQIEPAKCMSYT